MDPEMIQEIGSVIVRLGPIPKKMTRPAPIISQEAAAVAPPAGTILVASFLSLKQVSSLKTWKKRYYALYSNST
jgi:hypothetical protein